jgi:pSer/pThr/pTyr-binding forkhead associated (FHA) protein
MNAQILCRLRNGARLAFDLQQGESLIGRDAGLAVIVPAEGVSRRHARIVWDSGSYWISDLKSTNGTFVNGADVAREGRERLRHLDVIGLGREVELLFLMKENAPVPVARQGILRATLLSEDGDSATYPIAVGEMTLGRSAANNVVVDSLAISKLHVRIQRSGDQVVVQDLSSANGTFVNGARVMTALLQDGDQLSLANVVSYRVRLEWGEITSTSGSRTLVGMTALDPDAPQFSPEWKTRYEWDNSDRAALEALKQQVAREDRERQSTSPNPVAPRSAAPAAPGDATALVPPRTSASRPSIPILEVRLAAPGVDLAVTDPGEFEIGRADGLPLRVRHPTVSRRHARLVLTADRKAVLVENLSATSPATLNDAPLTEPRAVADGDVLAVGEVRLTVSIRRST